MGKVFVSYRRSDSAGTVGRICDRLKAHLGTESVFFDIDSIPLGVDFRDHINEVLSKIDVLISVIGPNWTGETAQKQWLGLKQVKTRRIDDPNDLVRAEVEAALQLGIPVIPAYIDRAKRLTSKMLPNTMAKLALRNDIVIDDGNLFDDQINKLLRSIDQHLGGKLAKGYGKEKRSKARSRKSETVDHLLGSLDNYVVRFGDGTDVVGINLVARMHFPEELILSKKEIGRWLKSNKGIFRVAAKVNEAGVEQQIVGYYAVFPISMDLYEKLKNHEVEEKNIRLEDFYMPTSASTEALYVLDLAKHEEEAVGAALLRDLVRYLSKIATNNPHLQKVGTWAFSAAGQQIAARLGMDRIKDYEDYEDTSFYEISDPAEQLSSESSSKLVRDILKSPFQDTFSVVA